MSKAIQVKNKDKSKKNSTRTMIISSLTYLVLGFFMLVFSSEANTVLCYTLGIVLTIYGLFNIISFFAEKDKNLYVEFAVGIVATAFGVFTIFSPHTIENIVTHAIAIVIIIDSLMDIKYSFQLKALGMNRWWICFLVPVAIIIFCLCTIFFMEFFGKALIILLGIVLIYEGISGFSLLGLIGHYARNFNENKMIEVEAADVD